MSERPPRSRPATPSALARRPAPPGKRADPPAQAEAETAAKLEAVAQAQAQEPALEQAQVPLQVQPETGVKAAPARSSYHHGNLRESLLAEAVRVIAAEGVENVSIRQLAKNLGVSAAAPFRHFADRKALLTAVAEQATTRLGEAVAQALQQAQAQVQAQSPWQQLLAVGQAYLRWAQANPTHFLVVSDRRLIDYTGSEPMQQANDRIRERMQGLLAQAAACAGNGQDQAADDTALAMLMMRAMVYGLARMQTDGHLAEWGGAASVSPEALTQQALAQFMQMLAGGCADGRGNVKADGKVNGNLKAD